MTYRDDLGLVPGLIFHIFFIYYDSNAVNKLIIFLEGVKAFIRPVNSQARISAQVPDTAVQRKKKGNYFKLTVHTGCPIIFARSSVIS